MTNKTIIINANIITDSGSLTNKAIIIDNCLISDIVDMKAFKALDNDVIIDAQNCIVTPGLIDTHIHGIGGFGTEDCLESSILGMSLSLAEFGVTSFIPTLYPNSKEQLFEAEKAVVKAMGKEKGAKILGLHIEGPFVNEKKSGALPKESISEIDLNYFDKIIENGQNHVICMTVAPELKDIEKLCEQAKKKNVVLLCGHTNATFDQVNRGYELGIRHSTHFFNAMSPLHHRNPGAVGAILSNNDMCCEIISDGVHVHPELVKLTLRNKKKENVVLVTDSLKPNHQKTGKLLANGVEVVLSDMGAFVSKEDPSLLNGSALTLNKALDNLQKWSVDPKDTVLMATANPSRIYNLGNIGSIKKGYKADISIFDLSFNAKTVLRDGKVIYCDK